MKNKIKKENGIKQSVTPTEKLVTEGDSNRQEELVKQNEKIAMKVSFTSLICNAILSVFKLVAGVVGLSYAMIADAIHSFSDVFTTIIVIIGVKISSKKADKEHPYGHDRFECIAALLLSIMLFAVGAFIGYSALEKLISGKYAEAELPKAIALIAAVVSILEQFVMFVITKMAANKTKSGALKADAWHHLSDSLSSIGSFAGILGAMLGVKVLDVIAGFIICILILKVSIDIFLDSVNKLIDKSASEEMQNKIKELVKSVDGVMKIDRLRTRQFGNNMIYVDLEIACDGELKLKDAHKIAQTVHDKMENEITEVKHCLVHINPYDENLEREYETGVLERKV